MAAINQHATVEKKQVNVCFLISYSPYSWFGLNLRHVVMPHMYCEMQNKLSNTRASPLGSMGEIISSRCPYRGPGTSYINISQESKAERNSEAIIWQMDASDWMMRLM